MCLTLIGAGFSVFLYMEWTSATGTLMQTLWESEAYKYMLSQVNATAPRVMINLTFTPTPQTREVAPNTITFIMGYVTTTNLTNILYPATMAVNFTVTHAATGNATVTYAYNYIQFQIVYLAKGLDYVQVPWGLWPLEVHGQVGDRITLYVTARVTVYWTYVNAVMADQSVTGLFNIIIVEA